MICHVCSKTIETTEGSIGTGYGLDKDHNAACYACCAEQDKRDMLETGRAVMYLTKNDTEVCNWPNSLTFKVAARWQSRRVSYWGQTKTTFIRFIGPDGAIWSGKHSGDYNEIVHVKQTKLTDIHA